MAAGCLARHWMQPPVWAFHRGAPSFVPIAVRSPGPPTRRHRVARPPFVRIDGLDGLRGVAVLAVLLFHLWPTLMPGGFIGVTLFFSLSGFLITSILVHELESTGSLSLRGFYTRRFRRLAPASLATLAAVAVVWSLAGWSTRELRRDLFFSLGQNANWGQVLAQQRYGVDASASPVLHFWSLAIEEQLYLALPFTILLCRTRRRARVAIGIGLIGSVVAIVLAAGSASTSYYSTFTRGGEVLLGAMAALALQGRHWRSRWTTAVSWVAAAAGLLVLAVVATQMDVTAPWFARGGLLMCAVVSVVVIAAVSGSPLLGRTLDWWPLARLGQISYAAYLFHWPLLQTLRRAEVDPRIIPWATITCTLALALASERWFERPIRSGAIKSPRLAVAAVATAAIIPLVAVIGASSVVETTDFEAAAAELDAIVGERPPTSTAGTPATVAVSNLPDADAHVPSPRPPDTSPVTSPTRIGFFGDSKALALALGAANGGFSQIQLGASFVGLGCPTGLGGAVRTTRHSPVFEMGTDCDWAEGIPANASLMGSLDVGVVWSGTWDVQERRVPALGNRWTNIDDPEYRAWLLTEMGRLTDTIMNATGAKKVLWLTVPADPASPYPERFTQWTSLVQQLGVQRPDSVEVVDVAAYVAASGEASRLLPDGVHPTRGADDPADNSGAELTATLLLPELTATS